MPSKKRAKGEQDSEVMLNDIEASQWNESRMYAIVQSLDTELQEIVQRLGSCLTQEIHPEHWEEFRERVRDLLDTFTEDLEDVLQGTTADDE
jgi:hypothetical protein